MAEIIDPADIATRTAEVKGQPSADKGGATIKVIGGRKEERSRRPGYVVSPVNPGKYEPFYVEKWVEIAQTIASLKGSLDEFEVEPTLISDNDLAFQR
jgi:hypothetical protein